MMYKPETIILGTTRLSHIWFRVTRVLRGIAGARVSKRLTLGRSLEAGNEVAAITNCRHLGTESLYESLVIYCAQVDELAYS